MRISSLSYWCPMRIPIDGIVGSKGFIEGAKRWLLSSFERNT